MPVSQQIPKISYVGNGSTTTFPYTYRITSSADLKVYVDDILQTSGYSVSGVGDGGGGSVTFTVPPASNAKIILIRVIALERITDYTEGGALPASVLDDDFDRLVMMVQDIRADSASLIEFGVVEGFLKRYLGPYVTAPTTDAEGEALISGALYWNVPLAQFFVWTGSTWQAIVGVTSTGYSAEIPTHTTATRDVAPAAGYFGFNTTTGQFEGFNGTEWGGIGGGGATGGTGNPAFYENDQSITADYTLTAGKNAMSAGPITIATGVTVTIPTGATWTIV